ncbi:MAG: septum formation initiator family protein [Clostridia bacterium]|nr:septum formation initiator family protein [Clostridia bacterium]
MTEKQLHQKVKLITAAALTVIVLLFIYILFQGIALSDINAATGKYNTDIEDLKRQVRQLEEEIEYKNSREFIEQYARENFDYGYANEKKYVINQ